MHKKLMSMVAVIALSLGLAACGSSDKKSDAGSGNGAAITIKDFKFTGATVKAGATVTVKNDDTTTHTVKADSAGFDTGEVAAGKTATFTAPATAGSYPFHCNIHQYMKGTLTVQ
jgi:plastocyanin